MLLLLSHFHKGLRLGLIRCLFDLSSCSLQLVMPFATQSVATSGYGNSASPYAVAHMTTTSAIVTYIKLNGDGDMSINGTESLNLW